MGYRKKKPYGTIVLIITLLAFLFVLGSDIVKKDNPLPLKSTSKFSEKKISSDTIEYTNEDPNVAIQYPTRWRGNTLDITSEPHSIVNLPGFALKLSDYYVSVSRITGYKLQINPSVQEYCIYDTETQSWNVQEGNYHYGSSDCALRKVSVDNKMFYQANTDNEVSRKFEYLAPILRGRYMISITSGYKNGAGAGTARNQTDKTSKDLQIDLDTFVSHFITYNPSLFK